jgi:hypothetical protein
MLAARLSTSMATCSEEPGPPLAKASSPGFARAAAIKSSRVW